MIMEVHHSVSRDCEVVVVLENEDDWLTVCACLRAGGSVSSLSAALAGCFDDIETWNSCMGADLLVGIKVIPCFDYRWLLLDLTAI